MSGEEIRFDFAKYDVGGKGAKAGDGKLTGEEVEKAKADGWNVWDGMPKAGKENQEPPRLNTKEPIFKFKGIQEYVPVFKQPGGREVEFIPREEYDKMFSDALKIRRQWNNWRKIF